MRHLRFAALVTALFVLVEPAASAVAPEIDPHASLSVVQQWIYNYRAKPDYAHVPAAVRVLFHSQTFREPESAGIYLGFIAGAIASNPAKAEQVDKASTADLNDDGFVTLDEVVAMERANLSDREMVDRLQRTGQVFELTEQQEKYLEDRGVSRDVVVEMREMNQPADYARTASARDARDTRDLSRDELHDPKKDQYRIRENDRPHDFQEIRQSDQAANTTESNRERF